MARLRTLLALFLITFGATFGALAWSGYYNPRPPRPLAVGSDAGALLVRTEPRRQFVAADSRVMAVPPREKLASVAAKPAVREVPVREAVARDAKPAAPKVVPVKAVKDKRPQQTAAQWPWPLSLFSN
jgi:hypothetical protein